MLMTLVYFVSGLVILVVGAEGLVRGSSALALRLGISPLVIGLTVVAFGTSSPELAVSVESAISGNSSIAMGNVIGSNIANIGLILGITALIYPMMVQRSLIREQIPLMIGISILIWVLTLDQEIDMVNGLFLFGGLLAYIYFSYQSSRGDAAADSVEILPGDVATLKDKTWFCVILITLGLGGLVGGGILFVNSAVEIARIFNVDEAIIGLTIVAIGTSMPELATSVVAAVRKESDIAIGNIVGSNIFNILGILGVASIIKPLSSVGFSQVDYGVMIAFAIILLPMAITRKRLSRAEGSVLLLGYVGYMYYIWPAS